MHIDEHEVISFCESIFGECSRVSSADGVNRAFECGSMMLSMLPLDEHLLATFLKFIDAEGSQTETTMDRRAGTLNDTGAEYVIRKTRSQGQPGGPTALKIIGLFTWQEEHLCIQIHAMVTQRLAVEPQIGHVLSLASRAIQWSE